MAKYSKIGSAGFSPGLYVASFMAAAAVGIGIQASFIHLLTNDDSFTVTNISPDCEKNISSLFNSTTCTIFTDKGEYNLGNFVTSMYGEGRANVLEKLSEGTTYNGTVLYPGGGLGKTIMTATPQI